MREAFASAGKVTRVRTEFLNEVDQHTLTVYLSGPTGDMEKLQQLAFATIPILDAGGIGVKIDTAGKAFEKEVWCKLTINFRGSNLYDMFVVDSIIEKDGTVFSCGMQNLGLKDTIVSDLQFQESVDLIRIFSFYQIVDKPQINASQTFQATLKDPVFRIIEESNPRYKNREFYGNPFGMWRLRNTNPIN